MRPEFLPLKINQAQRAISARLSDDAPADLEEQLALRDALNSLRALFPQPVKPNSSQKKATA
jgi:hypothetical protein